MTKAEILQRLERDLEVRGRSSMTVDEYSAKVRLFQDYYDKPADQMGESEIIKYLHHLAKEKGINASTVNTYNSALRFLSRGTFLRQEKPID